MICLNCGGQVKWISKMGGLFLLSDTKCEDCGVVNGGTVEQQKEWEERQHEAEVEERYRQLQESEE